MHALRPSLRLGSLPLVATLLLGACSSPGGSPDEIERDPEQLLEIYRETAYGHWENDDPSRAAAQALKALEIDPEDRSMRLILGWGLLRLGDRDSLIRAQGVFESLGDYEDYRARLGLAIVDERLGVLPVIMHSSLAGQANLDKGREAGCDEYIVKFEPKVLLDIVERYTSDIEYNP